MISLLSPAKKLLNKDYPSSVDTTNPLFQQKTDELIKIMQRFSVEEIASLMHLSKDLAKLNYQRYQAMHSMKEVKTCPAIYLFQGDVYQTLKAETWDEKTIAFSQSHLGILSGLYGLLRPLDRIVPYRLEMGTKLANSGGKNLYDFWGTSIATELNKRLEEQNNPILINLASTEYFNVVNMALIKTPIITIHFKEQKDNQLKVIGLYAKKARGMMANYIMTNQIDDLEFVKSFNGLTYQFCVKNSDKHQFTFIRKI